MMQVRVVKESIIDAPKGGMNPYVWTSEKKLKPKIKEQITDILYEKEIKPSGLYLIGSLTGVFWSDESDLDINVICDVDDETLKEYVKIALGVLNERYFFGNFPINFFFRNVSLDKIGLDIFDGIYDIMKDEWLKEPKEIEDVEEILKTPRDVAIRIAKKFDLQLDNIADDIEELVSYTKKPVDLKDKLEALEMELEHYISGVDAVHKRRVQEFQKSLEGSSLKIVKRYGSRNFLPWNICYKYLVKWLYVQWQNVFRNTAMSEDLKMKEVKELFNKFVKVWR